MENGYIVQSEAVMAFMKVAMDRLSILKKGSRTGYLRDPHSTVCSKMWGTPVESIGVVLETYWKVEEIQ